MFCVNGPFSILGDRSGMGGEMQGRRPPHRPEYDSRSRFRDDSNSRGGVGGGGYRQMGDGRGGRGSMGGRNDDRMYMRRVSSFAYHYKQEICFTLLTLLMSILVNWMPEMLKVRLK